MKMAKITGISFCQTKDDHTCVTSHLNDLSARIVSTLPLKEHLLLHFIVFKKPQNDAVQL